eukprot:3042097-Rhodomonas_salina.1
MKAGKKRHTASIVKNRTGSSGTAWRRRSTLVEVHAQTVNAFQSNVFKKLPDYENRIMDEMLEKKHAKASGAGFFWVNRRCILTADNLVMSRPERELVLDTIPLIEVVEIAHVKMDEKAQVDSEPHESFARSTSATGGPEHEHAFYINTHAEGLCAGRVYCLRATDQESCHNWVNKLQEAVKVAVKTARQKELNQGLGVWRSWSRK